MREARAFTEAELLPHADRFDAEGALPRAFIAKLASRHPSISRCGSCRMISRSLQVPGSDSSALTTR